MGAGPPVAPGAPLTWVVGGGGLLGGHVRAALPGRRTEFVGPVIPWSDPDRARAALEEGAAALLARADHWQVLWCAGAGVTGTSQAQLDTELTMWGATLAALAPGAARGSVAFASSAGGVYAGSSPSPFDESSPTRPLAPYGQAKLTAESMLAQWVQEHGGAAFVARIANLYGPGQDLTKQQGLVSQLCWAHLEGRPATIWVSLDTLRDYLYAPDCASLLLDASDRLVEPGPRGSCGSGGRTVTKVLASQRPLTIGAVIGELRRIFRSRPSVVLGASPTSRVQARDLSMVSRVWTDLDDRTLTTFPAGVAATLADLRLRRQLAQGQRSR
ncbi:NAD-dependent epimerase/dehydratase family protein [Terracoccus luteus]|uniref:NAD-dependent epimerase/dehydratase family protein n=1 Tax=Terracoccus luteus TaxID=53356 RepID=UPI000EACAF4A|nr:NAD-dependent epimerase/dehydratase family protein [Terracoccus luteus]